MQKMITRATALGAAFGKAALELARNESTQPMQWPARRTLINLDREGLGTVKEPAWNASLSYKTAQELKQRGVLA